MYMYIYPYIVHNIDEIKSFVGKFGYGYRTCRHSYYNMHGEK